MIEQLVKIQIESLAGGRVFAGVAPADTATPYLTYSQVGGGRDWTLAGPSGAEKATIQVSAWAATPDEAASLLEQAFTRLSAEGPDFMCTSTKDVPWAYDEAQTQFRNASMEFNLIR